MLWISQWGWHLWTHHPSTQLTFSGRGIIPPTPDIRWGTASTSGASTWFHIDSNGLGICITLKIWIFIKDDEGKFFIINLFEDFELDEAKGLLKRMEHTTYNYLLPPPF